MCVKNEFFFSFHNVVGYIVVVHRFVINQQRKLIQVLFLKIYHTYIIIGFCFSNNYFHFTIFRFRKFEPKEDLYSNFNALTPDPNQLRWSPPGNLICGVVRKQWNS
jgi:hypothetical protein